ncbi:MAG: prephenate dehydrogenase [Actinomycetota bacterium]|nr:prephenate dehydrogenase [Actinomycetota bacterium]
MADLLVVGAGLVGTSVALALHKHRDVVVTDHNPAHVSLALERGAGRKWDGTEPADLVLLAIPPRQIAGELRRLQRLGISQMWSHCSSSQSRVQREVETQNSLPARVCGGHPMAGSERSGPQAAAARLFQGRPWIVCAGTSTDLDVRDAVESLARDCGAHPVRLDPAEHDRAVALVSHLPQLASSGVAAQLLGRAESVRATAGPGLRDTTRIAASAPNLWEEVLGDNAGEVAPLLKALADDLAAAADALERHAAGDPAALGEVVALLARGQAGRALVPVKRGEHDADFLPVAVSLPDKPGQLAALLATAAGAGVNVEDVRLEHLAGRPRGLVELQVVPGERNQLRAALVAGSWELVD